MNRRYDAFLAWASEGSLAIYVLHQLAIVVLAAVVIRQPWSMAGKFSLLLMASVVATLAGYHFVVRPVPPLRRLFGMAPGSPAGREAAGVLGHAPRREAGITPLGEK